MTARALSPELNQRVRYWLPVVLAAGASWLAFVLIGGTPLLRASGLALVIAGMALVLRPMGAALALPGALALAFSPAFWAQTGGAQRLEVLQVALALGAAVLAVAVVLRAGQRLSAGILLGALVFGVLFLLLVGTPRSLRLTTLLSAWLLFLLTDAMFTANPRPDSPPTGQLGPQHTWGLFVLLALGVLNDPLAVLMAPAVLLGLFLTGKRLPVAYWLALLALIAYGTYGVITLYADTTWWGYSAAAAKAQNITVPYIIANGWREPARWLDLIALVSGQFTALGVLLGVAGLARLSRWYAPVGVVTMVAYGCYALFGLVYFGADASVLLLPLLMIQVFWISYAFHTLGQWLRRWAGGRAHMAGWVAAVLYGLMPLVLLLRIVGIL